MPAKVHLICGKIASGKSYYARSLSAREGAVILSCDEITLLLPDLKERHDAVTGAIRGLLMEKAAVIARGGCPVILDWGFWTDSYRRETAAYFEKRQVPVRWHYIDVSDETLRRHIAERNARQDESAYFVDEGLLGKCLSLFEAPKRQEMDEWIVPEA